ncbi:hypothetical protein ACHAWC_003932, partial [Mediolabrus comicus]
VVVVAAAAVEITLALQWQYNLTRHHLQLLHLHHDSAKVLTVESLWIELIGARVYCPPLLFHWLPHLHPTSPPLVHLHQKYHILPLHQHPVVAAVVVVFELPDIYSTIEHLTFRDVHLPNSPQPSWVIVHLL